MLEVEVKFFKYIDGESINRWTSKNEKAALEAAF